MAKAHFSEPTPAYAPARLRIDLEALAANWRALAGMSGPAVTTAAVVKGDGYGIGLKPAVATLAEAGCSVFFVATPAEGEAVRALLPAATVYILDGLLPGSAHWLAERDLRPVLGSRAEIDEWVAARAAGVVMPAALHVDTGMNRLGLTVEEAAGLLETGPPLDELGIALIMSHLTSADTPDHPANRRQRAAFEGLRQRVPDIPASLANSAGILLGPDYHCDLTRPGIALYGAAAADPGSALATVVTLEAQVLQIREAIAGETVGYGGSQSLKRASRIAILGAGYADGYHRRAGSSDGRPGARAYVRGRMAPLVGRVSMDLIAIDVTDAGEVARGEWVELFGAHIPVDDVAAHAETIGYELLTGLGARLARHYGPVPDPDARGT